MVLEVTGIGQLEFGFDFILFLFFLENKTRRRRGGNVEIRRAFRRISKPGGKSGKLAV